MNDTEVSKSRDGTVLGTLGGGAVGGAHAYKWTKDVDFQQLQKQLESNALPHSTRTLRGGIAALGALTGMGAGHFIGNRADDALHSVEKHINMLDPQKVEGSRKALAGIGAGFGALTGLTAGVAIRHANPVDAVVGASVGSVAGAAAGTGYGWLLGNKIQHEQQEKLQDIVLGGLPDTMDDNEKAQIAQQILRTAMEENMNDTLYKLACQAYGEIAVNALLDKEAQDSKTHQDLHQLGLDLGTAMQTDPQLGSEMINADAPAIAKLEGHLEDSEAASAADNTGTAAMAAGLPAAALGALVAAKHPNQGVKNLGKAITALGAGTAAMGVGAKGAATAIDNSIGENASLEESMVRNDMEHFNEYENIKHKAARYYAAAEALTKLAEAVDLLDQAPPIDGYLADIAGKIKSSVGRLSNAGAKFGREEIAPAAEAKVNQALDGASKNPVVQGGYVAGALATDTVTGVTDRVSDAAGAVSKYVDEANKPAHGLREPDYGQWDKPTPYIERSNAKGGMVAGDASKSVAPSASTTPEVPFDPTVGGKVNRALDSASTAVNQAKSKASALAADPTAQNMAVAGGAGVAAVGASHALGKHRGKKQLESLVSQAAEDIMDELMKVATCEADVDAYSTALAEVIAEIME